MDDKELDKFLKTERSKNINFNQSLMVGMMIMLSHWQRKYKRSLFFYPVFYLLGFLTHYIINLL
mgnify:CR=1 FL=1